MEYDFPATLRRLRERRGISRRTLSELCGLSKNMVMLYERGVAQPNMKALIAIADFFEVSVDDLVGNKRDP